MVKIKRKPLQLRTAGNCSLDLVDADDGMMVVFAYRGGLPVRVIAALSDAQVREAIRYMTVRYRAPVEMPLPEPDPAVALQPNDFENADTDVGDD